MAHSEKCPVCEGKGIVKMKGWNSSHWKDIGMKTTMETCYGCDGKGWIIVSDEIESKSLGCVLI